MFTCDKLNFTKSAYVPIMLLIFAFFLLVTSNNALAYTNEALLCYQSINQNNTDFIKPCRAAIEKNDSHAMYLLAVRSTDRERKIALLEGAANLNHIRAVALLSDLARNAGNIERAFQFEQRAAQLGHGPSRIRYALRLKTSASDNVDALQSAFKLLLIEAQNGFSEAQFLLGIMFANGEGVEKNIDLALRWLSEAASAGHQQAQLQLALYYQNTQPALAKSWLLKSAQSGNVNAMYHFARLNVVGENSNVALAQYWTHRAIRGGHSKAHNLLEQINQNQKNSSTKVNNEKNTALSGVAFVQKMLNQLGYDAGPVDGDFGAKTRRAIIQFEEQSGMLTTGKISKELLRRLSLATSN